MPRYWDELVNQGYSSVTFTIPDHEPVRVTFGFERWECKFCGGQYFCDPGCRMAPRRLDLAKVG